MTLKRFSNFIAAPGGLLLLVFYFLLDFAPDLRLSRAATETLLQETDPKLYVIPVIGLLVLLVALYTLWHEEALTPNTSLAVYVIPSMIGMGLMLAHLIALTSDKASLEERLNTDALITITYHPGWWLALLALAGIFIAGALVFINLPTTSPVEPARVSSSAPKATVTPPPPRAWALTAEEMKARMLEARELIIAKRYREARAMLRDIPHPTAEKWLQKLDEIAPE